MKFHTQYFPKKFQKNRTEQEDHEENFEENSESYSLPINGYIRESSFILKSRGSISARTIKKQSLSVSYDELSEGLNDIDRFVKPIEKRITWSFEC